MLFEEIFSSLMKQFREEKFLFFQLLELKEFSRHSYKNVMHNPKRTCGIHDHEKIKMLALLGRYLIELSWKSFRIPIHNLILNWKMFFQQFDLEMQLIHDKARHSMNSKQLVIIMKSIKWKKTWFHDNLWSIPFHFYEWKNVDFGVTSYLNVK